MRSPPPPARSRSPPNTPATVPPSNRPWPNALSSLASLTKPSVLEDFAGKILGAYDYTTKSGTQTVTFGDTVYAKVNGKAVTDTILNPGSRNPLKAVDEKVRRLWVSALQSKVFNDVLAGRTPARLVFGL